MPAESRPTDYPTIRMKVDERLALTIAAVLPELDPDNEAILVFEEGKFGFHDPEGIDAFRETFDPIIPGYDAFIVEPVKHSHSGSKFRRSTRHLPEDDRPAGHRKSPRGGGKPLIRKVDDRDVFLFRPPEDVDSLDDDRQTEFDLFDDHQSRLWEFERPAPDVDYDRVSRLPV